MEVFGIVRLLAEAGVVIGQETRQQLIAGGDRADPLKTQFLDQAILQGLVGALDAALRLRRVGAKNVDQNPNSRSCSISSNSSCPPNRSPKSAPLRPPRHPPRSEDLRGSAGKMSIT